MVGRVDCYVGVFRSPGDLVDVLQFRLPAPGRVQAVGGKHGHWRAAPPMHSHVKIEGKFTKPSATDALAARFAQVLDKALSRKLRIQNYNKAQCEGLESLLSNDVALT